MGNLRRRIELVQRPRRWLNQMAVKYHYMRRPIHPRACPFGWGVMFDGALFQPDGKAQGLGFKSLSEMLTKWKNEEVSIEIKLK